MWIVVREFLGNTEGVAPAPQFICFVPFVRTLINKSFIVPGSSIKIFINVELIVYFITGTVFGLGARAVQ